MKPSPAEAIQIEFYRKLSGGERLRIAAELRELSLKIMEAGLRDTHPEWTDDQIHAGIISRLLPAHLFTKVYPDFHLLDNSYLTSQAQQLSVTELLKKIIND